MAKRISKKSQILEQILQELIEKKSKDLSFDNDLVKTISGTTFKNQFDVTKLDNSSKLPPLLKEMDYYVIHLGSGRHRFVKGIKNGYHFFEEIPSKNVKNWEYRKSILNETDTSEASILSLVHNQRILHDFLYEDITANPKLYISKRTKTTFSYKINNSDVTVSNLQIEKDMIVENNGIVTILEGKNKIPPDFAVYQLFHPFKYYSKLREEKNLPIKEINTAYLLRYFENGNTVIRFYLYTFKDEDKPSSITLIKAAQYNLLKR